MSSSSFDEKRVYACVVFLFNQLLLIFVSNLGKPANFTEQRDSSSKNVCQFVNTLLDNAGKR